MIHRDARGSAWGGGLRLQMRSPPGDKGRPRPIEMPGGVRGTGTRRDSNGN